MAGHSQFKNIMYRKGAQDAKRAKAFTKVTREILVAVKEGGDDTHVNARLRAALLAARAVNMPKDNIERTIKKAMGNDQDTRYENIRYEGYGPGGVAIIVEALTDNRNRTAPEVRSAFSKYGGNLGEPNSVSFQFNHQGQITYPITAVTAENLFEAAIEASADDIESLSDRHIIQCQVNHLHHVREHLSQKFGDPESAKIVWQPKLTVSIAGDVAKSVLKLVDVLEDNDDVQHVFANYDIDESVLESLSLQ